MEEALSDVVFKKNGKCYWIILNRPSKKNAIHFGMYNLILTALDNAENDPEIMMTIFTGKGEYYSSGNDFSIDTLSKLADNPNLKGYYAKLIEKLINHTKLLIGLVNGPAIGIACTMLGLFDLVLASDKAYFYTPFTALGLSPEGCSSVLFPQILGHSKAAQLILFSDKMSAEEAYMGGLVSTIYKDNEFMERCKERIKRYEENLCMDSVITSKSMIRSRAVKDKLIAINNWEKEKLNEQMEKEECQDFLMKKFLKSKV
uniref:Enoyl-CoA delta isomerase 2, mitochondrial n=1 Tax=Strongyloides papillosus TaxID=174720 RepID=A0A0N5B550_STREA